MHCSLATGGPGAATRHAPFGRPRRPLGTFPRGESTSSARRRAKPPTRNRFLAEGRKRGYLSFPASQRVSPLRRRPGGFPLAPWTPSGPMPICLGETSHKKYIPCGRQGKEPFLPFPYPKGFRLCGGDQRAFRSPFGNLRPLATSRNLCKKQLPCRGQENAFLSFPVSQTLSPLRRRPGGFPPRPLSPFRWRKIFLPPHGAAVT